MITSSYTDRKTGLVIFGGVQIALGVLCLLLTAMTLFALAFINSEAYKQQAAAAYGGAYDPVTGIVGGVVVYLMLAAWFICMGVGSIKARRWARALILMFSWLWLLVGVASMIFMIISWPSMQEMMQAQTPQQSAAVSGMVALFVFGLMAVIYVVLPGSMIIFYGREDVKLTCEARDKQVRWTDKCPLPVLVLCKAFVLAILGLMLCGPIYNWASISLGVMLTGFWGGVGTLLTLAVLGYATLRLYQLDMRGWWTALVYQVYVSFSAALYFFRHDMKEMYQELGMAEMMPPGTESFYASMGTGIGWISLAMLPLLVGYMVYIKKHFQPLR